jgi:small subunit ribosomal protein S15
MARLYSKKKGKSGSKKPFKPDNSGWKNKDTKAVKEVILEMGKTGKTSSQIGIILRDSYAVPDVKNLLGKKVTEILTDGGLKKEVPDDLLALIRRDLALTKHMELNKHDMTAKRGQQLTTSKINRLVRYYKNKGILSKEWVYDKEKAVQWIV